jgi:methionyl aminopeptidase
MIHLKTPAELEKMRSSNRLVAQVMEAMLERIKPGVSTWELDQLAEKLIGDAGARPAFKGYQGFPATICASVNEQVVHGFPAREPLKEGDILSIDVGVQLNDYFGDMARTVAVGQVDAEAKKLMEACEGALHAATEQMREGNRLGDVSWAIQDYAESRGYTVVRQFVGHGIGRILHEQPQVPNFGKPGRGQRLYPGLILAIEPMLNCGTHEVRVLEDDWTVVTTDGRLSAHFEDTVAVTENGPEVLTVVDDREK